MMDIKIHTVSAFAKGNGGGNPAGVVLDAGAFSADDMLQIARQASFSETAFVQEERGADYKLRFFTPNSEIDLCGHATIATFSLLKSKGLLSKNKYSVETKQNLLAVEIMNNGQVYMEQPLPEFHDKINAQEIAECLHVSTDVFIDLLPIQIVSTGVRDILIPLHNLKALFSIKPDYEAISAISKKYNVIGFHVFTMETLFESTAHCRNFAPLYQIPEESATGTANGALSCYLLKYGMVSPEQAEGLVFEQGYVLDKPSEILVKLAVKQSLVMDVAVGGTAFVTEDKKIRI